MPPLGEIFGSLYGALRLARFDAGGLNYFNVSIEGFWRSFFAAGLSFPIFLFFSYLRFMEMGVPVAGWHYLSIEIIFYVIGWVAFPLLMISIVKMLGCQERYLNFMVAYNWTAVVQYLLYLPIGILTVMGVLPAETISLADFVLIIYVIAYTGFVVRHGLGIPVMNVIGVVGIDLTLTILIEIIGAFALAGG